MTHIRLTASRVHNLKAGFSLGFGSGHQLSLIGRNIGDENYIIGGGAIPGRKPIDNTGANTLDQGATTPLGRTVSLQYRLAQ